jgi:hypothetical protein
MLIDSVEGSDVYDAAVRHRTESHQFGCRTRQLADAESPEWALDRCGTRQRVSESQSSL